MKRYSLVLAIIFFLLFNSFKVSVDKSGFLAILEQASITFVKPANTVEIPVVVNDELNYQYAIKDTVSNIEIRYLVYPLQEMVKKYNGPHADTGFQAIDPNMIHTNLLLVYCYKIQDKELNVQTMPDIHELPHGTVDQEFNADWGAEVNVQPCDEFGQKNKYCTIFEIHKDNTADAFIMFLYNNKDTFEDLVKSDFHSLKFKK